jgi:hypothetical protein
MGQLGGHVPDGSAVPGAGPPQRQDAIPMAGPENEALIDGRNPEDLDPHAAKGLIFEQAITDTIGCNLEIGHGAGLFTSRARGWSGLSQ